MFHGDKHYGENELEKGFSETGVQVNEEFSFQ